MILGQADRILRTFDPRSCFCLSQSELDEDFAARSREAARAAASLAGSEAAPGGDPNDEAPFRRQE